MKHSNAGINLLRSLATHGLKVFTINQAKETGLLLGINPNYIAEALHHLQKGGWIIRLKRGVYSFSGNSGFGEPPHEFEIAMALVSPCAISHWTAMHYHHLTQQTPNVIFATTPHSSSIPRSLSGGIYHFIKIKKEYYFGIEKIWMGQSRIFITDPERTLIDGLIAPQYCGDFQEVLHAFKMHSTNINVDRIIQYALKLDKAIIKRLGWILERIGIKESYLKPLLNIRIKSYRKLDPTGPNKGPYNRKWMIQENIGLQ
jgi:predicted transcriptional regulator of viral defense system